MTTSLDAGERRVDYEANSSLSMTISSIWNGIKDIPNTVHSGLPSQNGGEWLFEGGEVTWCRRMTTTNDHTSVKELKKVLGIEEEGKEEAAQTEAQEGVKA